MVIRYAGCLLPFLLIFNLFFGWLFFRPLHWFLLEAVLVFIFLLHSMVLTRKMFSDISGRSRGDKVIDVEGRVIGETEAKSPDRPYREGIE